MVLYKKSGTPFCCRRMPTAFGNTKKVARKHLVAENKRCGSREDLNKSSSYPPRWAMGWRPLQTYSQELSIHGHVCISFYMILYYAMSFNISCTVFCWRNLTWSCFPFSCLPMMLWLIKMWNTCDLFCFENIVLLHSL